jgi:hypothetical protein
MTSANLLGMEATSFCRLSLSFSFRIRSSVISLFYSSTFLAVESLGFIFIQDQTFSIKFKSGLFPGHLIS